MVFALNIFLMYSKRHKQTQSCESVYVGCIFQAFFGLALEPLLRFNGQKPCGRRLARVGEIGKVWTSEGIAREGTWRIGGSEGS
jgi:hypothetical protein